MNSNQTSDGSPGHAVLVSLLHPPEHRRLDRPILAASLVAVLVFLAAPLFKGLGLSDLDGDESIYAGVVESVLEEGQWLTPRYEGRPFLEKPPLKFWLLAAAIKALPISSDERGLRTLDSLFGSLAFVYLFLLGWRLAGPLCGLGAVFFVAVHEQLVFVHGLRSNNMESMLVLAYCGGIYHFQRWSEGERARGHIVAVTAWFCFAFLGKFVAALFLPLILAACILVVPPWRRLAWSDRHYLGFAVAGAVIVIAPWFIYHLISLGSGFWEFIFSHHVYRRLTQHLDPAHVQPWYFYLTQLLNSYQNIWYYPLLGGIAWLTRMVCHKWWAGMVTLLWLAVPLLALSVMTSKLYHYAYSFIPPLALCGGYALTVAGRIWMSLPPSIDSARPGLERWLHPLLGIVFVLSAVVMSVTAATDRLVWEAGPFVLRNTSLVRPLLVAGLCLFALRRKYRAVVGIILVYAVALDVQREYYRFWERTRSEKRLLSNLAKCIQERASRRPPEVFVYSPAEQDIKHDVRHYFKPLRQPATLEPRRLHRRLGNPQFYSPVLVAWSEYPALVASMRGWAIEEQAAVRVLPLSRHSLYLILPGPYADCASLGWPPKD